MDIKANDCTEHRHVLGKIRDAGRAWRFQVMFTALLLALLNSTLHFTDVFQILGKFRLIPPAEAARQILYAFADRIENAGVLLHSGEPLLRGFPITAEHALEDDAGIQFHGQRLRRRAPRNRTHV